MLLKPFVKGAACTLPLLSLVVWVAPASAAQLHPKTFLLFRVMNWKSPALMSLNTIPRVITRIR